MILTIDIGNSTIAFGFFSGEELLCQLRTENSLNEAVLRERLEVFMHQKAIESSEVLQAVIGSVVPQLTQPVSGLVRRLCRKEPFVVSHTAKLNLELAVERPERLGVDRIANAAAARHLYGAPVIVADIGTATTVDAVSRDGSFMGGAIAPGPRTSLEALARHTAQLPAIGVDRPQSVVGRNTEEAMLSGMFFGQAALIDGLAARLGTETGEAPVVLTGGWCSLFAPECRQVTYCRPDLTLQGLRLLVLLNAR